MNKIGQAAKEFSEEQGQVPSAFAFQSGARWAMSQIFEAAERVERVLKEWDQPHSLTTFDPMTLAFKDRLKQAIRALMRLVRGEQPKEGEERWTTKKPSNG